MLRLVLFFLVSTLVSVGLANKNINHIEALAQFDKFILDFSQGKTSDCIHFFDKAMIGFEELETTINQAHLKQKNITVKKIERTADGIEADIVVVSFQWEKTHHNHLNLKRVTKKGKTRFFLQKLNNTWKLTGLAGANLFRP